MRFEILLKLSKNLNNIGLKKEAMKIERIYSLIKNSQEQIADYTLKTRGDPFEYRYHADLDIYEVISVDPRRANTPFPGDRLNRTYSQFVGTKSNRGSAVYNVLKGRHENPADTETTILPVSNPNPNPTPTPTPSGNSSTYIPPEDLPDNDIKLLIPEEVLFQLEEYIFSEKYSEAKKLLENYLNNFASVTSSSRGENADQIYDQTTDRFDKGLLEARVNVAKRNIGQINPIDYTPSSGITSFLLPARPDISETSAYSIIEALITINKTVYDKIKKDNEGKETIAIAQEMIKEYKKSKGLMPTPDFTDIIKNYILEDLDSIVYSYPVVLESNPKDWVTERFWRGVRTEDRNHYDYARDTTVINQGDLRDYQAHQRILEIKHFLDNI